MLNDVEPVLVNVVMFNDAEKRAVNFAVEGVDEFSAGSTSTGVALSG